MAGSSRHPYLNDLFVSVHDLDEWEGELIHPYTSSPWAEFFSGPAPNANGGTYSSPGPLPEDDPAKLAFLAELAAARVGYGNAHLGWGRMLRPPVIDAGTVALGYRFHGEWLSAYAFKGASEVPRVVAAAWESPDGLPAVFLCNVDREPATVTLDATWGGTVTTRTGSAAAGDHLELPARTIAMVA